jgi:hypothetical protein
LAFHSSLLHACSWHYCTSTSHRFLGLRVDKYPFVGNKPKG